MSKDDDEQEEKRQNESYGDTSSATQNPPPLVLEMLVPPIQGETDEVVQGSTIVRTQTRGRVAAQDRAADAGGQTKYACGYHVTKFLTLTRFAPNLIINDESRIRRFPNELNESLRDMVMVELYDYGKAVDLGVKLGGVLNLYDFNLLRGYKRQCRRLIHMEALNLLPLLLSLIILQELLPDFIGDLFLILYCFSSDCKNPKAKVNIKAHEVKKISN
ncbi:hypothetical protein ACLOJK_032194 [Asimina triloba]